MACPTHHGAWADREALEQLRARLENAAAIHHEFSGEKAFIVGFGEIVEALRHRHPKEIDCPDCGVRLIGLWSSIAQRAACSINHSVYLN
jgi:hypothetical protein